MHRPAAVQHERPQRGPAFLNSGGLSDAVFDAVASFPADDANRFVADVEAVRL